MGLGLTKTADYSRHCSPGHALHDGSESSKMSIGGTGQPLNVGSHSSTGIPGAGDFVCEKERTFEKLFSPKRT